VELIQLSEYEKGPPIRLDNHQARGTTKPLWPQGRNQGQKERAGFMHTPVFCFHKSHTHTNGTTESNGLDSELSAAPVAALEVVAMSKEKSQVRKEKEKKKEKKRKKEKRK